MMNFELFKEVMSFDTQGHSCIEILFTVKDSDIFSFCWMGKMPDEKTKQDLFWYGLTPDGKNAYDYPSFEEFSSAKVFDGQSLLEIWDNITIEQIDGCDPMDMAEIYLSNKKYK